MLAAGTISLIFSGAQGLPEGGIVGVGVKVAVGGMDVGVKVAVDGMDVRVGVAEAGKEVGVKVAVGGTLVRVGVADGRMAVGVRVGAVPPFDAPLVGLLVVPAAHGPPSGRR